MSMFAKQKLVGVSVSEKKYKDQERAAVPGPLRRVCELSRLGEKEYGGNHGTGEHSPNALQPDNSTNKIFAQLPRHPCGNLLLSELQCSSPLCFSQQLLQ